MPTKSTTKPTPGQRVRAKNAAKKATSSKVGAVNTKPAKAVRGSAQRPETSKRAAAAAAKLAAPPAPVAVDYAAMESEPRLKLAKAENLAVREWKAAGSTGDRPATPTLDWMSANPRNKRPGAKSATGRGKYTPETGDALKARITTDRAAGLGFPKIADALNSESFDGRTDWTGPKLYAFACRQGIGDKLSAVKVAS